MRLNIQHTTRYQYAKPARYALQQIRMRPRTSLCQTVIDWTTHLEGAQKQVGFTDQHGNLTDLVELSPMAEEVVITVVGTVETHNPSGIVGSHDLSMPLWFYLRQTPLTRPGARVESLLSDLPSGNGDIACLHELSLRIRDRVIYQTATTSVSTTAEEALSLGTGVCQDHAHILISAARKLGYPARYVSGYLMMNDRVDQEASHAWAEVHIDGLGWVGFDVSNAISPDERYVQVARGLDYHGAAPTAGLTMGAEQENLIVSVHVQQ